MVGGSGNATALDPDVLHLQKSDRSVRRATEDEFFNYTTKRWLFNEAYELSIRRVHFNIRALFETVVDLIGNGATRCVYAMKFREGQYNKVFQLVMDNGAEVVAKIPNPNCGPAYYTTASEVATVDFLRTVLGVPVPKVLSWSSVSTNPVGSEYIIMEKAKGVLLSEHWYSLKRDAKNTIISQIVDLEGLLASKPFTAHGCLFYQQDISAERRYPTGFAGDTMQKFALGPLVDPELWADGRERLHIHKGPWTDLASYATDLGRNEREWVTKHGKSRINYFRSDDEPEKPSEMVELLEKYLKVAPYISQCPQDSEYLGIQSLCHPDLNLSNIFIDPETNEITSIIDWQGSRVEPLVLHAKIPRMAQHFERLPPGLVLPERPSNYESLDPEARQAADKIHESALCQKYYEVLTAKRNGQFYSAILHNESRARPFIEPLRVVCGSWKNRDMYKLRSSLIRIMEYWHEMGPDLPACPITSEEDDVERHDAELEDIDYVQSLMEAFEKEGILPADGIVDPGDFETLEQVSKSQKMAYLLLAKNEEQRILMERTWPWQDWPERRGSAQLRTE